MTEIYIPDTQRIYDIALLTMNGWELYLNNEWIHPQGKMYSWTNFKEEIKESRYWSLEAAIEENYEMISSEKSMEFIISVFREQPDSWISEVKTLPGTMAKSKIQNEAIKKSKSLGFLAISQKINSGEINPNTITFKIDKNKNE